jgi:hypothetical protein
MVVGLLDGHLLVVQLLEYPSHVRGDLHHGSVNA